MALACWAAVRLPRFARLEQASCAALSIRCCLEIESDKNFDEVSTSWTVRPQRIVGVGRTVTLNEPDEVFWAMSVAMQLTPVMPSEKVAPDCGVHDTVEPGLLSLTRMSYVTMAP